MRERKKERIMLCCLERKSLFVREASVCKKKLRVRINLRVL